jgi:hypothetical protein
MRMADRRLHLLVEGQTEETIVSNVLQPELESAGWLVTWSILRTKRPAGGPAHRGGVTSWAKLEREIKLLLRDTSLDVLSTVIDYYAFPQDAPGMGTRPTGDPRQRVEHVEQALASAIGDRRFVSHLTLHEAESWVFAAAEQLGEWYGDPELAARLLADSAQVGGPELVNDSPATAPSKRLCRYRPDYVKTLDGPAAVAELGLPRLRAECPHLDRWLAGLFGM